MVRALYRPPEDRDQKTQNKAPWRMLGLFWLFAVLFFCVWYLVFCYFDCLDFWFCRGKRFFQETKSQIPNKQQTKIPKKTKNKIPKNKETTKQKKNIKKIKTNKTGSAFSVERCFFGFWSWSSSGSTDTIGGLKLDLLPTLRKQTPHSRAESSQPPKSNLPFSSRKGGGGVALEDFPNRGRV